MQKKLDTTHLRLDKAKLDSFTILIPIENVKNTSDTNFMRTYKKLFKSNENEDEFSIEDGQINYEGYKYSHNNSKGTFCKYKVTTRKFGKDIDLTVLQIVVTTKLLESNYFQGINLSNFKQIYDYIINDDIVTFSYEDLLNSYVTDIDICKDYSCTGENFVKLKSAMSKAVIDNKQRLIFNKRKNNKECIFGIQYNRDRASSTPTSPFGKLYFKTVELLHSKITSNGIENNKSKIFSEINLSHLLPLISEGITRIEFTVKASAHKTALGIQYVKTVRDLLQLNEDKLNELLIKMTSKYYEKQVMQQKNITNERGVLIVLSSAIDYICKLDKDITSDEILNILLKDIDCKHQRSRMKEHVKKALELSNSITKIKASDIRHKNVLDIMKDLHIFE
jgi:hypothetical protein